MNTHTAKVRGSYKPAEECLTSSVRIKEKHKQKLDTMGIKASSFVDGLLEIALGSMKVKGADNESK